ncbi:hypothetical protein SAMN02745975_00542 [Geosporobacter subterraneus DSM 17957]|uniref:Uncharacterized protein n=1 Tax=Geosporobacter subterraneus DSM 17957 TaxID=1121919 RepID=A0A1M6DQU3_9FIRM|nr:hypothetical protein [Geosporobacter subterraneus]SHI75597.1 hypothetical protein SAMN02745975_00542 [Geosporobacter subterraneus DSM 17957]
MEKHRCKVKFKLGKIECASEFCADCADRKTCEDMDVYLDDKYDGSRACMSHDSHKRENRRVKQQRWEK